MNYLDIGIAIILMTLITFGQKCVPFLALSQLSNNPVMQYLGRKLPASVMLILCLYMLQENIGQGETSFFASFIASILTATLHLKFRHALLSISGGVLTYGILKTIL